MSLLYNKTTQGKPLFLKGEISPLFFFPKTNFKSLTLAFILKILLLCQRLHPKRQKN